ncbi:MAG: quinol:cytochrome C oxidoreductase [Ignavibacteriaceae bacterium]|nr:quinol:cytochrome C oxidoreductase [Ignavibacteriaceae bacterium]
MNYLLAFALLISVGVGALFLVTLEYVAGADWSVPIRRVTEFFSSTVPYLLIIGIPLLFNIGSLFHWSHPEAVAEDKILQSKAPYLNTTFFIIRFFVVGLLWTLFWFLITRNSRKQDITKDQVLTKINIRYSAIFIPVFAITISVASIDWIMSLDPHWFSTIFGVYFFAGTVLASLSAVTYAVVKLFENGYLHPKITKDHLYSLGALLFAFINFWGYIAFSQYMLIWYANLPEETFWYLNRWEGMWIYVSLILIIVHFVVPYSVLLSQPAKMDPKRLKFAALWIIFAHLIDLYWLIMPNYHAENSNPWVYLLEFAFPMAAIGVLCIVFYLSYKKSNLLPLGDPKLERGLKFKL